MGGPITRDPAAAEAFARRVLGDTSAAVVTVLAALGDRLGLFKSLAAEGPATSEELSIRTKVQERYAREWLSAMASAGYLRYEPGEKRFALPPENAPALAHENGSLFFGGFFEMLPPLAGVLGRVEQAFRNGGGVPQSELDEDFWEEMERLSASWFENSFVQRWIPAIPEVERKLREGAQVADVGCGRGRALIKLAQAYPRSRFVGYDLLGPSIALARKSAWLLGVADRVSFEWRDAADGLPARHDIITTFDALHDAAQPRLLLRRIREALNPKGTYVCLDTNCSESLEDNAGPVGGTLLRLERSLLSDDRALRRRGGAGNDGPSGAGAPEAHLRDRLLLDPAGRGGRRLQQPLRDPPLSASALAGSPSYDVLHEPTGEAGRRSGAAPEPDRLSRAGAPGNGLRGDR